MSKDIKTGIINQALHEHYFDEVTGKTENTRSGSKLRKQTRNRDTFKFEAIMQGWW